MPPSSDAASDVAGERLIPTPAGDARAHLFPPAKPDGPGAARATLVLGHGAGGGIGARDLAALAAALPAQGLEVVAVEQPWKVAGKKIAPAPATLDTGWLAVLEALAPSAPLIVGGRSAGARVACRTAARLGAAGVLALAFPLHPPGRPDRSRLAELLGAGTPVLVVQGERDPFGTPAEFPADLPAGVRCVPVPAADHGFAVARAAPVSQEEALGVLVGAVSAWLGDLVPPG
jgi:predicted alpha/beta-hydrolase family hydrolase